MDTRPGIDLQAMVAWCCFCIAVFWAPLSMLVYWTWVR